MQTGPESSLEEKRLAALKSYQILDTLPKETFDRFTKLASIICNTPISLVSLIDEDRQWFKSKVGLDVNQTPRDIAFCHHSILGQDIMEVQDATKDFRFKNNPLVTSDPNIKFYAGYPLKDSNGYNLGTICVIDRVPRKLDDHQKEALKILGDAVVDLIAQQRKVQETENFNELFKISKDIICVFDYDGIFRNVNPAFGKLLSYQEDYILNRSIYDFIHPDDLSATKNKLQSLAKGNKTVVFTNRLKGKDDSYKILQWAATPEPSSQLFFAIARDITTEKEKEILIERSEARLRAFFENSSGFMCTHNLAGKILTINSAGAKSLGYETEELVGHFLHEVVPESRKQALQMYLEGIVTQGKMQGLMYTKHKKGNVLTWLFNNVLETDANGDKYVIGNAVDITERHQLEADLKRTKEMLETTNEVAKIGAWEADMVSQNIYWSNVTKEIHEVEEDFIPSLESGISFYTKEHQEIILNAFNEAKDLGIPFDLELQIKTKKGKYIWIRSIGKTEFIKGKCVRIYGTFQDINENYLHRSDLKKAKLIADQANSAKSEFLASMSHEIRTPLNGVIGFTDLVLKTTLNQTQQQYLNIVNQSANSLLVIINDILDFSKIEAGKLELDIEKSDLFELSSQASDIITYQAQNKGLEVLLNIDPKLPRFVFIDNIRLKQVLVNLLGNAVKFTESGEIELKIYADSNINDSEIDFHFEVRDTGIGIQSDKQNKIFEAFSQEDASTTKKYGGTGLGLTISNKLLGLMGSKLQLKSRVGQGSTFYFKIRLKAEEGNSLSTSDLSHIKNVLVVDDNENNRIILRQMLLLKNIKVTEAKNGLEALQLLTEGKGYDVILMDYHMPFMDGLETIEKIRNNFNINAEEQPIMLLHSSSDDEKIINICEKNGVRIRMVKPIKMQDLFNKLTKINKPHEPEIKQGETSNNLNNQLYKILVAEDNIVNKLLAKTVIERILPNAIVYEVNNGLEAVNQYKLIKFDLILMDLQMPEMNGYEATQNIRIIEEKQTRTPIIALTAGNILGEKEKCLAIGMDDFVAKPFVEKDLNDLFSKWLINKEAIPSSPIQKEIPVRFNRDKVRDFMGNDTDTIKIVLNLTIKEIQSADDNFKKLISDPNPNLMAIKALGHKLYGTAAGTGLEILSAMARQIEWLEKADNNELKKLYKEVSKEIELCKDLIHSELASF
ncbi:hybrid sensor histidine kinase/response regulator [Pedobacter psychrophilus]|uniref:Sensory/regulatory protein RpfC n=1 Tax=Pedobacter psychrophilus TaxID=1826909 RepID=A0A179DAD3_9SPHI|nr:response regulator [Pedobacter psychrophilus]OAQ38005.1 hybrid sensor histidine kinase/response regulator [Pedobacter psychrophilus]